MTKTLVQAVAITLSAVATFGTVVGANGLAGTQFASAQRVAAAAMQVWPRCSTWTSSRTCRRSASWWSADRNA